jgi:hypothetical protein
MDNSLVTHLKGYVEAVFKDLAYTYRRSSDWTRDKARLLHELETKGDRILTLDLPALNKHFRQCLAKGLYSPSGLYLGRLMKVAKVPCFMGDLYLQIFDAEGNARLDASPEAVAAIQQLCLGAKKLALECPRKGVVDEIKTFIAIEAGARRASLNWLGDDLELDDSPIELRFVAGREVESLFGTLPQTPGKEWADTLHAVADRVASAFGDLHTEEPSERPRHGPGVVANQRAGTSKYQFDEWPLKLDRIFPSDYYASPNLGEGLDVGLIHRLGICESPSRLICVPKTRKGPRLIAAEPNQHQWIQQLVMNQLVARLERTPIAGMIRFNDQTRNQELALSASASGSHATIDLSEASDRLTCWVVERFFRKNPTILERFHAARSRWMRNRVLPELGEYLLLKKFSTMGSAVTFPVQSIVYGIVAVAAILHEDGKRVSSATIKSAARSVSVFGDDIVVPTRACRKTVEILEFLGLKVNAGKTFWTGKFRESCGVDGYMGVDVAPAYLRSPSRRAQAGSVDSLVETSNNFFTKGWWHTAKWLETTFLHYKGLIPIVPYGSGAKGLTSFTGGSVDHLRRRWNADLHRWDAKVLVPFTKTPVLETKATFRMHQYFTEQPEPTDKWVSGTRGRSVADMRPGWASCSSLLSPK